MFASPGRSPVGRLAPSPTGALHVGNARTFLVAWLSLRSRHGRVLMRIEDIDSPRVKREAIQETLDDLRWLGLDWDAGPDLPGKEGPFVQSERLERYAQALSDLIARELVYPCDCTRRDIQEAASAPHWEHEGPIYPGRCASRAAVDAERLAPGSFAWRFRVPDSVFVYDDRLRGYQQCSIQRELGDFVIAKKDGTPAYQLAVVVDDHAMDVDEVVRGDDLAASTFRQLALYSAWGWDPPEFAHVPLVIGPDGHRLAKRHGDTRLSKLRQANISPERLVGHLAYSLGLIDRDESVSAAELVAGFSWSKLTQRNPWIFSEADIVRLANS